MDKGSGSLSSENGFVACFHWRTRDYRCCKAASLRSLRKDGAGVWLCLFIGALFTDFVAFRINLLKGECHRLWSSSHKNVQSVIFRYTTEASSIVDVALHETPWVGSLAAGSVVSPGLSGL